ncbi:MAG: hypothetical protein RIS86_1427 [Planctomycetota bacterium]|jgi:hypothetical protein
METAPATAATLRLVRADADRIVLSVPGTGYELDLVPAGTTSVAPGKRLRGTLSGRAQKLHRSSAGGEFIEPVQGHPRIVQGRVRAVDAGGGRLLVQAVVPMWIEPAAGQSAGEFRPGEIVNFYMESGVAFAPEA